jgi:hypothetical protein
VPSEVEVSPGGGAKLKSHQLILVAFLFGRENVLGREVCPELSPISL